MSWIRDLFRLGGAGGILGIVLWPLYAVLIPVALVLFFPMNLPYWLGILKRPAPWDD